MAAMQQKRPGCAGHKHLPLVVPMLFYRGVDSPYPFRCAGWMSLRNREVARRLYAAAFPLVDITVSDDDIMQHRRIALLSSSAKNISASATCWDLL